MLAIAAASLAIGASLVNAVSISSQCSSALTSLALGSGGECLNIAGLVPLVTLSSDQSVIPSIDTWLTGLCTSVDAGKCNNDVLQALGTNITTACGDDLTNAGLPASTVQQIPSLLQQYYGVGSEAFCTRDTSKNNVHCLTSELNILQSSIGTNLTASNVVSSVVGVLNNATLEKELACTTCVQGVYAILRPELGSSLQSSVEGELNQLCGSGFASSTQPSQIVVATGTLATSTSTSTHSSGAAVAMFTNPFSSYFSLLASMAACLVGGVFGGLTVL